MPLEPTYQDRLNDSPPSGPSPGRPDRVIGLSTLDPWQSRVAMLWEGKKQRIWVRGSGKTFLAAHLIARSLLAGRPVLVIAPDTLRLAALQRELSELALDSWCFLYDASKESRHDLAATFGAYKPERASKTGPYHPPRLALRHRELAKRRLQTSGRAVFDRYPASVAAGLLLESRRKGGELLLDNQIGTEDFLFTGGEYFELRDQLEQTQAIYQRLQLRTAGLENLHTGIFLHQTEAESRQFITDRLQQFSSRARELYRDFLQLTAQFERLESQRLGALANQLDERLDRIDLALAAWADSERAERGGRPAWQWFFLRRWGRAARRKKERWEKVRMLWQEWRLQHQEEDVFSVADWDFPPTASAVRDRLQRYRERLQAWRSRSDEWVRDELMRLNAGTLPVALMSLRPALRRLEKGLERLVAAVNESGLYQLPLRADMLTSLRQRKFLETLLEQFEHTERHLAFYRDFYRWQRHWFGLPARLRRVTRRLLTLPDENWPQLFSTWYFEQCLRRSDLAAPLTVEAADDFTAVLRAAERAHIDSSPWVDRKAAKWSPVPTEDYKVFWRNRPRALLQRYPVWLTTPSGADHLALGNVRFADLIVETADMLDPVEWDFPAERLLVAGAEPAPKGYTEIKLEGFHRHGVLQPLLAGGPSQDSPGTVVQVDPAAALPTLVREFQAREPAAVAEHPIAVTTLDPTLLAALQAALPGTAYRRIVAPKQLLGTTNDELLIYGPPPVVGHSATAAEVLIDLLLSVRNRITLVNSATEEELAEALLSDGVTAKFIWAAAVRYLRYRNSGEEAAAQAIAREVHTRLQRRLPGDHPLLREIATLLSAKDDRLSFEFGLPWRSVYLPAVVKLPDGRRSVLIPAEGFTTDLAAGPEYDQRIGEELTKAGFLLTPVDTLAWWRDPAQATQDLISIWGV